VRSCRTALRLAYVVSALSGCYDAVLAPSRDGATSGGADGPPESCPPGYAPGPPVSASCYRYVAADVAAQAAEADCADDFPGTHLVVIESVEENAHAFTIGGDLEAGRWIGLVEDQGLWRWVTGSEVTYLRWWDGKPDSDGPCAWLWIDQWDDEPCTRDVGGYVCEHDGIEATVPVP
jgi:hypothetical protein